MRSASVRIEVLEPGEGFYQSRTTSVAPARLSNLSATDPGVPHSAALVLHPWLPSAAPIGAGLIDDAPERPASGVA